jgi:hypothetical protein
MFRRSGRRFADKNMRKRVPVLRVLCSRVGMLSTPHKRFAWSRLDRAAEFTFFRALMMRRRPPAPRRVVAAKKRVATGKWKPAKWTPWLWVK